MSRYVDGFLLAVPRKNLRAHRDSVNRKVMKDPRILTMMEGKSMPFDVKRMAYGGFKVLVDA